VHNGISLHFHPLTSSVVHIRLGTSAEDLNCDLGPPLRVHYKEDNRMNIHASRPTEEEEETDCERHDAISCKSIQICGVDFYNYFHLGLDFLISGFTHNVKKIILHSNMVSRYLLIRDHADSILQPGSPVFQRYARCPWEIQSSSEDDDDGWLCTIHSMHRLSRVDLIDSPPHAKFHDRVRWFHSHCAISMMPFT
jgi:phagosome assembly factor 1